MKRLFLAVFMVLSCSKTEVKQIIKSQKKTSTQSATLGLKEGVAACGSKQYFSVLGVCKSLPEGRACPGGQKLDDSTSLCLWDANYTCPLNYKLSKTQQCYQSAQFDFAKQEYHCASGNLLVKDEFGSYQCILLTAACPSGQKWDEALMDCVDGVPNPSYSLATPTCSSGKEWNGSLCVSTEMECLPPYVKNGNRCYADVSCPEGSYPSSSGCVKEILCPDGFMLKDGVCVSYEFDCPLNSKKDGNQCVVTELDCPSGSRQVGSRCLGDVACPQGSTLVDNQCVATNPLCPAGTIAKRGSCMLSKIVCPSGSSYDGVTGRCYPSDESMNCPQGSYPYHGTCVTNNIICSDPNALKVLGSCIAAPLTCPAGSTLKDGVCIQSPVCLNGNVDNLGRCVSDPLCLGEMDAFGYCSVPKSCQSGSTLSTNGEFCIFPSTPACLSNSSVPVFDSSGNVIACRVNDDSVVCINDNYEKINGVCYLKDFECQDKEMYVKDYDNKVCVLKSKYVTCAEGSEPDVYGSVFRCVVKSENISCPEISGGVRPTLKNENGSYSCVVNIEDFDCPTDGKTYTKNKDNYTCVLNNTAPCPAMNEYAIFRAGTTNLGEGVCYVENIKCPDFASLVTEGNQAGSCSVKNLDDLVACPPKSHLLGNSVDGYQCVLDEVFCGDERSSWDSSKNACVLSVDNLSCPDGTFKFLVRENNELVAKCQVDFSRNSSALVCDESKGFQKDGQSCVSSDFSCEDGKIKSDDGSFCYIPTTCEYGTLNETTGLCVLSNYQCDSENFVFDPASKTCRWR